LLCRRLGSGACGRQLPFANRVHHFYASNRTASRPKGLEPEHGTREPFHGSMVLFYDIIEIFRVADDDRGPVRLVVVRNRCRIRATAVDGNLLRQPLVVDRLM
jgi:hypothetical protein